MTNKSSSDKKIRQLQLEIAVNEMLPADMQCRDFIARRKAQLAALQKPAATVVKFEPRR
jgi:hypothetical protein